MVFQQTLRWIQAVRAVAVLSTCASVILFTFTANARTKDARDLVQQLLAAGTGALGQRSGLGSLALFGLALSLVWNGLGLFDLAVKKHYRFDRRTCMSLDVLSAVVLLVTGFLNFTHDLVLYFDAEKGPDRQMIMETAAVAFLCLTCVLHITFFALGCNDAPTAVRARRPGSVRYSSVSLASSPIAESRRLVGPDLGEKA